jgi:hypothetical protein
MRRFALPPQFGWPGALAMLALALAWPLAAVLAPRWQDQAQALRATRAPPPPPKPMAASALLPVALDVNVRVAGLLGLAAHNRVLVERSQQRQDEAGPVPHLLLTMSARGGYAELREFLVDALQADPGLALVRLRWRRPDIRNGSLEAELQWSLLMPVTSPSPPSLAMAEGAGVGVVGRARAPSP